MSIKGFTIEATRESILSAPNDPDKWSIRLSDRDVVDDKEHLDATQKQPLPYLVLIHLHPEQMRIFSYLRGKKGMAPDLHNNRSIGFGGHIDTMPEKGISVIRHFAEDCCREVLEETGVSLDPFRVRLALQEALNEGHSLMIEDDEPVHSVHLGIPGVYILSDAEAEQLAASKGETGQVVDIRSHSLAELVAEQLGKDSSKESPKYELWSVRFLEKLSSIFAITSGLMSNDPEFLENVE